MGNLWTDSQSCPGLQAEVTSSTPHIPSNHSSSALCVQLNTVFFLSSQGKLFTGRNLCGSVKPQRLLVRYIHKHKSVLRREVESKLTPLKDVGVVLIKAQKHTGEERGRESLQSHGRWFTELNWMFSSSLQTGCGAFKIQFGVCALSDVLDALRLCQKLNWPHHVAEDGSLHRPKTAPVRI